MKENKDWKKELKDLYNSCGFDHVSNCGCFGECNCVDNLTKLENFIDQIISERDKEILKELEALREKHGGFAGVVLASLAHNLEMGDY